MKYCCRPDPNDGFKVRLVLCKANVDLQTGLDQGTMHPVNASTK